MRLLLSTRTISFSARIAAVLLPVLAAFGQEGSEFRKFTSSDGKTIEAKAVSSTGDTIKIEMKDGRSFDLPIARLSATDQEWIAEWKKNQARQYIPSLKISFDENKEESNDQTGFVYIESFSPELEITNQEESFELTDAKATVLLIVEEVENKDTFRVLSRETVTFSLPAGESRKLEGKKAETRYATIQAHGAKYAGHAVIIENASGKVIAHDGSRGWDKNPGNAMKAQEGSVVREDFVDSE